MQGPKVIFTLDGVNLPIQCNKNDVMKDICQKYVNKIKRNINTLLFIYEGNILNNNLKYKDINKESNEIKILVYSNENDEFICPKCGEKIKLNSEKKNNIILSINNLKKAIDSAKALLENIIKNSTTNSQLRGIDIILNTLNDDIKKIKEKVIDLLNENNDNNYIIAEINIKENDINKNIRILNSFEECVRTANFTGNDYNEDEIKKCEIQINYELIPFNYFYKFKSKGRYFIKYSFKYKLKNTCCMFNECSSLTNINLSNFDTNNVTDMRSMFDECSSLTNINLSNFDTKNVTDMRWMFCQCYSLTNINLSNFNTKDDTDVGGMFAASSSLTKNNIITEDKKILNSFKK